MIESIVIGTELKRKARRLIKSISLMSIAALTGACNSLFYYPMSEEVMTPEQANIDYVPYTIQTRSKVKLAAWWLKADPSHTKNRLLVQFHGNAENMSTHFKFVAWLPAAGVDVVTFDYRGYGRSDPKPPTQKGLVEDGCAILEWIRRHPELSQRPLYVLGQSLGGAVASSTLAACLDADVKGLIIDSSFSSYRKTARLVLSRFWLTWPFQYPLSWLITDEEEPMAAMSHLTVPLLAFHSPADPVVPYRVGEELFAASASADKEFVAVSIKGHTTAFATPDSPYKDKLLQFISRR
jgi:fermentation-respiration switch protein FrsA (DUF1100 family)